MEEAIRTVYGHHPLLSARIRRERDGRALIAVGAFPEPSISLEVDTPLSDALTRKMSTPINPLEDRLVRFVLFDNGERRCTGLLVVCHHMICDGMSLILLLKGISEYLAGRYEPISYRPAVMNRDLLPVPPVGPVLRAILAKRSRGWDEKSVEYDSGVHGRIAADFLERQNPRHEIFSVPEGETRAFIAACKANRVSVNSALVALIHLCEREVLPQRRYRPAVTVAVDLREKLRGDLSAQFGYFASAIRIAFPGASPHDLWAFARRVHKAIAKKLNSREIFLSQAIGYFHPHYIDAIDLNRYNLRNDADIRTVVRRKGLDRVSTAFIMSNLGLIRWEDDPGCFGHIVGPFVQTDVSEKYIGVVTYNGRLSIGFSYGENILKTHDLKRLIETLRRYLDVCIRRDE